MSSKLSIIAGQHSDKGLKESNEDSCIIRVPDEPLLSTKGILVAIADGVSSSSAGKEASEACIKGLASDYYSTPESWTVRTSCQKVLGAINHWLFGQGQKLQHSGQGMLTTLSAVIIKSSSAYIFHVGDSRVYRLRGKEFERLTRDHNRWGSSEKSFLSRAMGADYNIDIDYRSIDLEVGDTFFLSTDGVHEFIRTQDLANLIQTHYDNPERATREIVRTALENGSNDNVSCQVCRIDNLPAQDEEAFYQKLTELPFPPPLENGMVLDGYNILREVHSSNRTQVYLAIETDSEKKVIIKTPSVNYDDDAVYIDSFLNEEWAGRRINNAHVLKILDPIKQRHFLYYVCEYIEGQTLRQWMTDNPRPTITEARNIIQQIVKGVRAMQRQEMVHQDLKPENIMIDKHGTVKIVDFGSTKIAGIDEINKPIEGKPVLGTIAYSAPEFSIGETGTHISDIFSIGVIFYEMFTGKLPYGKPFNRRNIHQLRYIPVRSFNTEIPAWLDAAIKKSVVVNPRNRYHTLSEFMQDITMANEKLYKKDFVPIVEKNPQLFWKTSTLICIVIIVALLLFIATRKS